jgi:hypothetical protein
MLQIHFRIVYIGRAITTNLLKVLLLLTGRSLVISFQKQYADVPVQPAAVIRPPGTVSWFTEDPLLRSVPHGGYANARSRHHDNRDLQDSGALQTHHHHGHLRSPVTRAGCGGTVDGLAWHADMHPIPTEKRKLAQAPDVGVEQ